MADRPTFETVVRRHGPTVLRVCRAVVGPDDADDAWSETFLSALRAYPELPADANVEAWLVTIAHRRAIDVGRARSRRAVPAGVTAGTDRRSPQNGGIDAAAGPTVTAVDADGDSEVLAALAALPDKQRHAVAYHHLAGLPYGEVAGIIGGTPAAARRAAADGIASLRRTFSGASRPAPARSADGAATPPDISPAASPRASNRASS